MYRTGLKVIMAGLGFWIATGLRAAEPAKATHAIEPVLVEVAATKPSGDAWDTGIGAFSRPDPQVTLMRHDEKALREVTELLVMAQEKRFAKLEAAHEKKLKKFKQPLPPQAKELFARSALQTLRCGVTIQALQDDVLTTARAKMFADTQVANDTVLAKLIGGALNVAVGDKVTIFVNEIDLAAHDAMGETDLTIIKEMLEKGELELKFNSIESLRLKIAPLKK